eukprot:gene13262-biopygen5262
MAGSTASSLTPGAPRWLPVRGHVGVLAGSPDGTNPRGIVPSGEPASTHGLEPATSAAAGAQDLQQRRRRVRERGVPALCPAVTPWELGPGS